ncbi:hypothetical protein PHLCEN_2v8012 [Hermanssonia centrifuga]|uniref:Uncharacterized protein n=1 Tax=Hermanssonia centrifuga TaxID=98765 RepID=A0A2R6NUX9_9APHY|nr:hypothetical protein PHLCEN_2v8012 [Hermanssonia centrifuga]
MAKSAARTTAPIMPVITPDISAIMVKHCDRRKMLRSSVKKERPAVTGCSTRRIVKVSNTALVTSGGKPDRERISAGIVYPRVGAVHSP